MRLQLTAAAPVRPPILAAAAALIALGGGAATARAGGDFDAQVQVYVDSDHTQVVSPLVHAQADVTPTTEVQAGYVADVVSSASVDIVTQASKITIHDVRHQGSLGASKILGDWTARGGYIFSTENDYTSNNFSLGVERRLAENATTLALGYQLSLDQVGRAGDANFGRSLTAQSVSATWTQVLTPDLAMQLSYELGIAHGFQASPYRFVPVAADAMSPPSFWVPETDPEDRYRHAAVLSLNKHLFEHSAIQGDYRFYRDTWGITSHTVELRYLVDLSSKAELRLRGRVYTQSGAGFYQASYAGPEKYMTIDRELGPLSSVLGGIKLTYKLGTAFELSGKLDLFHFSYPEFPRLRSRLGANIGLGLSAVY